MFPKRNKWYLGYSGIDRCFLKETKHYRGCSGWLLSRIKSSLCVYALESLRKPLGSGVIICIINIFLSEDYKKEETQGGVDV